MRLYFSRTAPQWLRRLTRRWVRRLNLDEWRIETSWEDAEDYAISCGEDTQGITVAYPEYFSATISYPDALPNDEYGADIVLHELRHLHYAPVFNLLNLCWDGRRRISKAHANRMFSELVEKLIQQDVTVLRKAYRNK